MALPELLIMDEAFLERLPAIMEEKSPLIVEHRLLRMARAPDRFVFTSGELLAEYIREHGRPGDRFYFWRFEQVCTDEAVDSRGILPDAEGNIPPDANAY
jgi:hypothetical protein